MPRMREFLYVSHGKLDRFGSRGPRAVKSFTASAGVPPASASLSVTADDRDDWQKAQVKLRRAVRSIRSATRWYQDDDVAPGDWIRFSGDLGYRIIDSRSFRLFVMTHPRAGVDGEVALLLFGSASNTLLGRPPVTAGVSDLDSYAGNLLTFIRDLVEADATGADQPGLGERDQAAVELFSRVSAEHDATEHVEGIAKAANVIDRATSPGRLIVASPLYVEVEH